MPTIGTPRQPDSKAPPMCALGDGIAESQSARDLTVRRVPINSQRAQPALSLAGDSRGVSVFLWEHETLRPCQCVRQRSLASDLRVEAQRLPTAPQEAASSESIILGAPNPSLEPHSARAAAAMSQEAAPNPRRKAWVWPVEAREERCPICLDHIVDTVRALPCRHIFCRVCIQQWTANNPSCPLCRQRIFGKQRLDWRPSAQPPTRRPQGRLQRTRERRDTRSARRSRSVPARSPPRSRSRSPRRLVRSSSWHGELNQRSRFEESPREDEDREWLRRVARERQMGAGEHARHPDGPRL